MTLFSKSKGSGETSLFSKLKRIGGYTVKVTCQNCGKPCAIKIKKGVSVVKAIGNKDMKCDNCGVVVDPKEYTTEWLK